MKKVINPCMCKIGNRNERGFCKIELVDGRLSICGVIAPYSSGNCGGSCGQCTDEIRESRPIEEDGWTREMLDKFCDIWDRWHLNDMRPYCSHMKEFGWDELASEKVKITTWNLKREIYDLQRQAENRAKTCLKNGETFIPTKEETMYANLEINVTIYNDETFEHQDLYEFKEKNCIGRSNVEYKTRGWISEKESKLGLINKACPVCGYRYGTSWIKEDVPQDVIDWLFNLPDTKVTPAWV